MRVALLTKGTERELRGSVEDGAFFGPSASRHLSCLVGTLADRGKLDEAHEVLRDQARRERYRRAIEEKPPS